MAKPVVFVTRSIPHAGIALLESRYEVRVRTADGPISGSVLLEGVAGATALLPLLTDPIDTRVMDASGGTLKIIANLAVGFDNIDLAGATSRNIWVTNTPGVLTEATADLTWALILAATRSILPADRFLRQGRFKGWDPLLFTGMELNGKILGILGMGRIGAAVARRGLAFGMQVIYVDPKPLEEGSGLGLNCRKVELDELLAASDILTLHAPLTPQNAGMFGADTFCRMKPGSYFINAARGKLHDEKALAQALQSGHLRGAGLDVYEAEPDVDPTLTGLDNVVLLPHIASATEQTRSKMATLAASNCLAVLDGKRPPHALNEIAAS